MSKILITADVHAGIPKKLEHSMWALRAMYSYAIANKIQDCIILGDLFHDRVSLNIEVINSVYDFFGSAKEITWWTFPGNHDMYLKNSWDIHSLKPLADLVKVIPDVSKIVIGGGGFWVVPFIYQEEAYIEVIKKVEASYCDGDVLLTHIGVTGAKLNECFLIRNWNSISLSGSKFDRIFAGHFHCYQNVGDNLWYPGSPVAFRFDEGLVPHGFIVYDTVTRDVKFVLIDKVGMPGRPPGYVTMCEEDADSKAQLLQGDHVRIVLGGDKTKNELLMLEEKLKASGVISISWVRPKEDFDASAVVIQKGEIDMRSPGRLLEAWVNHDNPEDIDKEILTELNDAIIEAAEERIISEVGDD